MEGHKPVLLKEVIEGLDLRSGMIVLDATLGGGGHALEMCKKIGPTGKLVGIDEDEGAIRRTQDLFGKVCDVHLAVSNFRNLQTALEGFGIKKIDAVLFDLGLSSFQLETSGRGFSFMRDEPLLMTFGENAGLDKLTAEEIVNSWGEESLADVIYGFGGERYSRRIAKAIVEARTIDKIKTTGRLVEIIESAVPAVYRRGRIHPATKTFQALRMAVNDELNALKQGLADAWQMLSPNGRIALISFHEIEDRIVKNFFKDKKLQGEIEILTKKPMVPGFEEVRENPRSRSAKLRMGKKII